jgi:hypothetical protein
MLNQNGENGETQNNGGAERAAEIFLDSKERIEKDGESPPIELSKQIGGEPAYSVKLESGYHPQEVVRVKVGEHILLEVIHPLSMYNAEPTIFLVHLVGLNGDQLAEADSVAKQLQLKNHYTKPGAYDLVDYDLSLEMDLGGRAPTDKMLEILGSAVSAVKEVSTSELPLVDQLRSSLDALIHNAKEKRREAQARSDERERQRQRQRSNS